MINLNKYVSVGIFWLVPYDVGDMVLQVHFLYPLKPPHQYGTGQIAVLFEPAVANIGEQVLLLKQIRDDFPGREILVLASGRMPNCLKTNINIFTTRNIVTTLELFSSKNTNIC